MNERNLRETFGALFNLPDGAEAPLGAPTTHRPTERPATPVEAPAASTAVTVVRPGPDRARVAAQKRRARIAAEREECTAFHGLTDEEHARAERLLLGIGCPWCGREMEAGGAPDGLVGAPPSYRRVEWSGETTEISSELCTQCKGQEGNE